MERDELLGKRIYDFEICEVVGSGAFGTVYKAVKVNQAGKYVRALKHIKVPNDRQYESVLNSMGGDVAQADSYFAGMLQQIVSEIEILNKLSEDNNRHVVKYFDNKIEEKNNPKRYDIFLFMEYLTPLPEYLAQHEFTVKDAMRLGSDILKGLQHCHNQGVIHRDVKGDNIFVTRQGVFKIGDFGVSKSLKHSSKAESLKGTPNYLAPEVYSGKESYSKTVDLYSLGIVLYRLLNYMRNPFLPHYPQQYFAEDEDRALAERMSGKTPDMPSLGGEFIGNVIVKAISDKNKRYKSAKEFFDDLQEAIACTDKEILNEVISTVNSKLNTNEKNRSSHSIQATIADSGQYGETDNFNETYDRSTNKGVFCTIAEDGLEKTSPLKNKPLSISRSKSSVLTDPPASVAPLDKGILKNIYFLAIFVLLIIGVLIYYIAIPYLYGQTIGLGEWLFSGRDHIIATLKNTNKTLGEVHGVLGIIALWYVWFAAFCFCVFMAAKQVHEKKPEINIDAVISGNDAVLQVQYIQDNLKLRKNNQNAKVITAIIQALKRLEDKIAVDEFGYGDARVTSCENNIAMLLNNIENLSQDEGKKDLSAWQNEIMMHIKKTEALLRQRAELKKRR